jgi:Lamin Tail Domain
MIFLHVLAADAAPPFPHPLITEVFYAVPAGSAGDANGDGSRHATGDEFVELFNPHDRPIQLKGYTLRDRNPDDQGALRFTFPALELKPRQAVVVFNGFDAKWTGPVGESDKAPTGTNEKFGGAYVFTMRADSEMHGFANAGDWVLLAAPDGKPVQCVTWGEFEEKPPAGVPMLEESPKVIGRSVQRPEVTEKLAAHPLKPAPSSPGVFPLPKPPK